MDTLAAPAAITAATHAGEASTGRVLAAFADTIAAMQSYQSAATMRRALQVSITWLGDTGMEEGIDAASLEGTRELDVALKVSNGVDPGATWSHNLRFLEPKADASAHARLAYQGALARLQSAGRALAQAWQAHPVLRPMACKHPTTVRADSPTTGERLARIAITMPAKGEGKARLCFGPDLAKTDQGFFPVARLQEALTQAAACTPRRPQKLLLDTVGARGVHLTTLGACLGQPDAWKRWWNTLHHPHSGLGVWADAGPITAPTQNPGAAHAPTAQGTTPTGDSVPTGDTAALQQAWDTAWNAAMALPEPPLDGTVAVLWTGKAARLISPEALAHWGQAIHGKEARAYLRAIASVARLLVARHPLLDTMARKKQVVFHFGRGGAGTPLGARPPANRGIWISLCGEALALHEIGQRLAEEGLATPHPHAPTRALQTLWIDVLAAARADAPPNDVVAEVRAFATPQGMRVRVQWHALVARPRADGTFWSMPAKLRRATHAFAQALYAGWPGLLPPQGAIGHTLRVGPHGPRKNTAVRWQHGTVWWTGMIPTVAPCHGMGGTGPQWLAAGLHNWKRVAVYQAPDQAQANAIGGCLAALDASHLWREAF